MTTGEPDLLYALLIPFFMYEGHIQRRFSLRIGKTYSALDTRLEQDLYLPLFVLRRARYSRRGQARFGSVLRLSFNQESDAKNSPGGRNKSPFIAMRETIASRVNAATLPPRTVAAPVLSAGIY